MVSSPLEPNPHVVIFPFMAQGHTLPLLDLSKVLTKLGLTITVITTPSNAPSIQRNISNYLNIHIKQIPFPVQQGLPNGCEHTSQLPSISSYFLPFVRATIHLQQPFEEILRHMRDSGSHPICVISDFFLWWTLATCQKFNVPRLVFHGMGVLPMVVGKYLFTHAEQVIKGSGLEQLQVQISGLTGLPFTLTELDMPEPFRTTDPFDSSTRFLTECGDSEFESWGVIVNSFSDLEGGHVESLESFYKKGCKAWCVGPIYLYDEIIDGRDDVKTSDVDVWLDKQEKGSVLYVAFGTQAHVSDDQLDEVVLGLEMSGHPFICVIRSATWVPPDGFEERVYGRGLVVRDWVEQRSILANPATGGFLSHCGWNSVMESLSMGVPILAWPMIAEQPLNAKVVVEGMGAGLGLPLVPSSEVADGTVTVRKEVVCEGVMELMGSKRGVKAREKAEEIGRLARRAVQENGSSRKCLNNLIDNLIR